MTSTSLWIWRYIPKTCIDCIGMNVYPVSFCAGPAGYDLWMCFLSYLSTSYCIIFVIPPISMGSIDSLLSLEFRSSNSMWGKIWHSQLCSFANNDKVEMFCLCIKNREKLICVSVSGVVCALVIMQAASFVKKQKQKLCDCRLLRTSIVFWYL